MLPTMVNNDGIHKLSETQFGGYNHRLAAKDGDVYDETNICSDYFPVLSPRKPRYTVEMLTKPNGFYCSDAKFWADGGKFYADGEEIGDVDDSKKTFCSLGRYIVILPDKKYYDKVNGTLGDIECSVLVSATFTDGSYAGEAAERNTVHASTAWTGFKVGDAVTISGSSIAENNQTIIIREISGNDLRFYENSFTNNSTAENITVARTMPDIDYMCENENRLWGCKGDTIYASKLGDIFNWNVFDGVSTDSWAADVGSAGDFTGCVSYLGYPVFMKEENIYKVYGDRPSNFQLMGSATLGTAAGCGNSFGIANETLFYMARTGIVAYTGGIPSSISSPFGDLRYSEAVGGSDGTKYYVSMRSGSAWHLFVYDTRYGMWCREDDKQAIGFGWDGDLYFLASDGKLYLNGNAREAHGTQESAVQSSVEFADFVEESRYAPRYGANKKGTSKVQLRVELDAGASLTVQIKFDNDAAWTNVKTLTATAKRSFYLPIIPRRSDHYRIKLTGTGNWKLYSLARENYYGSEL